jgi:UDP-glucuronate 4-epimerase
VYASSSSVYGENKKVPFETTDNVDYPISLYAATKKEQ